MRLQWKSSYLQIFYCIFDYFFRIEPELRITESKSNHVKFLLHNAKQFKRKCHQFTLSQLCLRIFFIALAVAQASSYSSDSTPAWELPYAMDAALKKLKKKKKKQRERIFFILSLSFDRRTELQGTCLLLWSVCFHFIWNEVESCFLHVKNTATFQVHHKYLFSVCTCSPFSFMFVCF